MSDDRRNGVVLVCLGRHPAILAMTRLVIRSVRDKGEYSGEVLLLSDAPEVWASETGMSDGVRVLTVDPETLLNRYPGLRDYPRHWIKMFKPFLHEYGDFSGYDKLLYLDIDVLVNRPLQAVFDAIDERPFYFTYAARRRWIDNDVQPYGNPSPFVSRQFPFSEYQHSPLVTQSQTGVCSGVFGLSARHLDTYLNAWKQRLLTYVEQGVTIIEQMALNEVLLEAQIPAVAFPDEWVDYPLTPMLACQDRRQLQNRDSFVFHHFNPGKAEVKLQYMKAFYAFGKLA